MQQLDSAKPVQKRHPWKAWLVLLGFLAVIGYLMTTEHRIHTISALPYLLLLACPLMMLFMNHGDMPSQGGMK